MSQNKPTIKPYREIGSVEGYVKTVDLDGYGRPVVTITTRLDKHHVRCVSSEAGLDKIGHLEVGKAIEGLRVKLHGLLHYKAPGTIDYIEVKSGELFSVKGKLPNVIDLVDPDFTGGKRSDEFIREGRDFGDAQ